jgi:pseudouridine-5'-phosphate glycosidase
VPHRVDEAKVVADVLRHRVRDRTGVLLTVPIPQADEIPAATIQQALQDASRAALHAGITGPDVTPYVLAQIEKLTNGGSVPANLSLAENNAAVAAEIAVALAST